MKKIITQDLNNAPESKEILKTASKTFAGSKKIYLDGSKPEIKVPMREILQTDSLTAEGKQKNRPLYVYDTSGPYTCLLYTSPSPRDPKTSRMPSSA